MATIRLVPSAYTRSSTSRVTVTDPENMYYNTDHTTNYCTIRGRNSSSNTYYAFIHGFNFDDVPSNATVSSVSVKIRCYRNSYLSTNASYAIRLASSPSNSSAISNTTLSDTITTTSGGSVYTIPIGDLSWYTIKNYASNFSIEVPLRSTSNQYPYLYVYGAEIEVTYSEADVHVTGVSLPSTASVETGSTTQLTATISPSNATNKNVTWSSGNTSVATVSNDGTVTGVSAGTAVITVTTADGGYTDTCTVTVTAAVMYDYKLATSMVVGKKYLIASGNSGSVRLLSNESGGSRQLVGVAATVSNNRISINSATRARVEYECVRYTSGNDVTITVKSDNKYLYSDNSSGLRLNAPATLDRFWHYRDNKFWQFKSTSSDGYTDTSSEYKYYLELNSSNNFTDNHLTSPSVQDSTLPAIYIFVEDDGGQTEEIYIKQNGSWAQYSKVYLKTNGSWVEQDSSTWTTIINTSSNYRLIQ